MADETKTVLHLPQEDTHLGETDVDHLQVPEPAGPVEGTLSGGPSPEAPSGGPDIDLPPDGPPPAVPQEEPPLGVSLEPPTGAPTEAAWDASTAGLHRTLSQEEEDQMQRDMKMFLDEEDKLHQTADEPVFGRKNQPATSNDKKAAVASETERPSGGVDQSSGDTLDPAPHDETALEDRNADALPAYGMNYLDLPPPQGSHVSFVTETETANPSEKMKSSPVPVLKHSGSYTSSPGLKIKKSGSHVQFKVATEDSDDSDVETAAQRLKDFAYSGKDQTEHPVRQRPASGPPAPKLKDKSERLPRELFVQMHDLQKSHMDWQWRERARWIKFEEDVEEGAQRWGKPHVPSLSFHSLLQLRNFINDGVVLLDLEAYDILEISDSFIEYWISQDLITEDMKDDIVEILLTSHKPQKDTRSFLAHKRNTTWNVLFEERRKPMVHSDSKARIVALRQRRASEGSALRTAKSHEGIYHGHHSPHHPKAANGVKPDGPAPKRTSSAGHLTSASNGDKHLNSMETSSKPSDGSLKKSVGFTNPSLTSDELAGGLSPQTVANMTIHGDSRENSPKIQKRSASVTHIPLSHRRFSMFAIDETFNIDHNPIMKCLEPGAEGASVMVGEVDMLQRALVGFVRLDEPSVMDDLLEVAIPVRFLFVILGPPSLSLDYHEIGRSMGALLSNQKFREMAYQADNRQDLLNGLHSFLDDTVVLPAGNINKSTLLPVLDDIRRQAAEKRRKRRQSEHQQALEKQKEGLVVEKADAEDEEEGSRPLDRTGRCFGGLIKEIKRRYPKYPSDIKDGLNLLCLAVFFFLFFACLSPAITFGGLLSQKTERWMGVTETLFGTCVAGVVFHIFAGQPLLILGHTGPLLLFESALFDISSSADLDFMGFRFWVCIWVAVIAVVLVALEGSFLVRYITRFTEEIFASLISILFIYEVFVNIAKTFDAHPLSAPWPTTYSQLFTTPNIMGNTTGNSTEDVMATITDSSITATISQFFTTTTEADIVNQPNTALLSLILTMSTFGLAYIFKQLRASKFLGRPVRRIIGDFGVPLAILIMVLIDAFAIEDTYTAKLKVPDGLTPTRAEDRPWIINPMGVSKTLPVWAIFVAAVPALLAFILIFMETEITSIIVNKKERMMKKGTGFHLDILIIGLMTIVLGLIGCPILCSATVRSVTHVNALTIYSQTNAPGEKPKIVKVKEQRLTGFFVHVLLGVATLLGPVLRQVPLPVLFGIFLYMGVASMNGIQLFERVELFFVPVKHHPDVGFVRRVRTWKMHLFTVIQLICFAVLWVIKSTQAALAFPFVLILHVPFRRFALPHIFTVQELAQLDKTEESQAPKAGEDEEEEEEFLDNDDDDEEDAYTQAHMPV